MGITKETIDRVKRETDIVALISKHVQLKKVGKNFKGICPFHRERSPSFVVSQERGFHCFGCHKSGDAISWQREFHGQSFNQAIEELARSANILIR